MRYTCTLFHFLEYTGISCDFYFSLPVDILVGSCCLSDQGTAWILDLMGRIWFTNKVTAANPFGNGHWWQVSVESFMNGPLKKDTLILGNSFCFSLLNINLVH